MTSLKYIAASCVVAGLTGLFWASSPVLILRAQSQDQGSRYTVSVKSGRPLMDAVQILEQRHAVVITYEDPPYRHTSQREDRAVAGQPPSFSPRGGAFSFEYVLPQRPSNPAVKRVLSTMLRQFNTTGYAGDFQLDQTREMFHVVPITRRAENGQDVTYDAILSTELSFATTGTDKSALEALAELTEDLQLATGVTVIVGVVPSNLLNQTRVGEWTGIASCRSHLIRILGSTRQRLSWQLRYGPNDPGRFVLNVHMVGPQF